MRFLRRGDQQRCSGKELTNDFISIKGNDYFHKIIAMAGNINKYARALPDHNLFRQHVL